MIFTGTINNSGATTIDQKAVALIKSCAEAAGWTTVLSTTTGENHEWMGEGPGLSGNEKIYVGVRSYRTVATSLYRLAGGIFTGFIAGATYANQPGYQNSWASAHPNVQMDPLLTRYYIFVNDQRITAVFVSSVNNAYFFHAGKFFQFSFPTEYPYPVCMNVSVTNTLPFRTTSGSYFYKPGLNNATPGAIGFSPWSGMSDATIPMIEKDNVYNVYPVTVYINGQSIEGIDVYGTIDGIFGVSGYNLVPRSVIQVGGTPVDQTGMSDIQACNAIVAAGGTAYIVFFHGTGRSSVDAFAVKWE